MSNQPSWNLIAQLGDANPIDYGGYFIYRDATGAYTEEAEWLETDDDDDPGRWAVYRFALERCTYINGILSDNKFHPELDAWFAGSVESMASCIGVEPSGLIGWFCSDDPLERAEAYRIVGQYHGFVNLDAYPLEFTNRDEVESRYSDD